MLSSSGSAGGGYQQLQERGAAAVFTAAQWAELEQQALIYKYLMAGVPDLLLHPRSFANPAASPFHHHPSMSYYAYYGKKLDPEPWRCRRTDGKKWRCGKEAHHDSKYCERHMHRGRSRSRKPVESNKTPSSPAQLSSSVTDAGDPIPSLSAGAKTHGLSLAGPAACSWQMPSSYGSKYSLGGKTDVGELSFFSGNSRGFTIDSPTDSSWHSLLPSSNVPPVSRTRDSGPGLFSQFEPPQQLGQVTIASLCQEQENQPLRAFLDEWPGRRDSALHLHPDGATSSILE